MFELRAINKENVNNYDYYQPSYHKGGDPVPMFLMSYNRSISNKEYKLIVNKLNREVYKKQGEN